MRPPRIIAKNIHDNYPKCIIYAFRYMHAYMGLLTSGIILVLEFIDRVVTNIITTHL